MSVFKQDATVREVGKRTLWLSDDIKRGPRTHDVEIHGIGRRIGPSDSMNNYIYEPGSDRVGFNAAHTLAVVQRVLVMYRRALQRVRFKQKLEWFWGDTPIQVYPEAGERANAYYSRNEKSLRFFYFPDRRNTRKMVYTCQSWDVVAHETGHAILDSLKPGWIVGKLPETQGLHEAFGDITSLLSVLDELDMCETVIAESKGDLRDYGNILAVLGEEFGTAIGRPFGLRNLNVDVRMSDVTTEVHDISRVFTGAVYDIVVRMYERTLDVSEDSPAETLFRAAKHMASLFLVAILESPSRDVRFRDVARKMVAREPSETFKTYIHEEFSRRQVFDSMARPKPHEAAAVDHPSKMSPASQHTYMSTFDICCTMSPEMTCHLEDNSENNSVYDNAQVKSNGRHLEQQQDDDDEGGFRLYLNHHGKPEERTLQTFL